MLSPCTFVVIDTYTSLYPCEYNFHVLSFALKLPTEVFLLRAKSIICQLLAVKLKLL